MLLSLFSMFCFQCIKVGKKKVEKKQTGTMVESALSSSCGELSCWKHSPEFCSASCCCVYKQSSLGIPAVGSYPNENIPLSFAVLLAAVSISKLLLVFLTGGRVFCFYFHITACFPSFYYLHCTLQLDVPKHLWSMIGC